jgi:hypothetical protein
MAGVRDNQMRAAQRDNVRAVMRQTARNASSRLVVYQNSEIETWEMPPRASQIRAFSSLRRNIRGTNRGWALVAFRLFC